MEERMSESSLPESSSTIRLRDGRTLGIASVGPTDGLPIFYFHGRGVSRLEVLAVATIASACEVRLLSLDRAFHWTFRPEGQLPDSRLAR